jgi:hypothetical protein
VIAGPVGKTLMSFNNRHSTAAIPGGGGQVCGKATASIPAERYLLKRIEVCPFYGHFIQAIEI